MAMEVAAVRGRPSKRWRAGVLDPSGPTFRAGSTTVVFPVSEVIIEVESEGPYIEYDFERTGATHEVQIEDLTFEVEQSVATPRIDSAGTGSH